jgi:hypothetical protein
MKMRELDDIQKDLDAVQRQIDFYKAKKSVLEDEKAERVFADFCEKYGVQKNDIVRTEDFGDVIIVGIDKRHTRWILCRKIKKNGEPYANTISHLMDAFKNCKRIGSRYSKND